MVDPALALIWFVIGVGILLIFFWPGNGLAIRLLRVLRMTERVRIEDALKHAYNEEYANRTASIDSVAGALEVSRAFAVRLVSRLEARELVHSSDEGLQLTAPGRDYALRVLRTHRLWERYLADRTNVKPTDWHDEAERREHRLAATEVDALAASMGHPVYDPHGDPIPTAEGELPPRKGVALTSLEAGQVGTIVHLEDEPRQVFEKLVAADLAPLMRVELIEASPDAVRFKADGEVRELAPVAATNITVHPLPTERAGVGPYEKLSSLSPGESAVVVQIAHACQGPQRRRLLDLGVVPGTVITAELQGALSDPIAYRIRSALIALRRQQADLIYVERDPSKGGN